MSGDGGSGSGNDECYPFGEHGPQLQQPTDRWRWGRAEDSATSGLGFMSALQRAIILEQQQPQHRVREGGSGSGSPGDDRGGEGDVDGRDAGGDGHGLELLSVIAACCEVRARQSGLFSTVYGYMQRIRCALVLSLFF